MFTNPFKTTREAVIAIALIVATLIVGGVVVYNIWQGRQTAKTENKLNTKKGDASLQSGQDAVQALGNQQAAEQKTDAVTQENNDAIRKADGADAPVAAGVRDAGLASLCRRASHRRDPKCMQHSPAR